MTRPKPPACPCGQRATWAFVACAPEARLRPACDDHLPDARADAALEAGGTAAPILVRRLARPKPPPTCEWVLPLHHAPWARRCPAPATFIVVVDDGGTRVGHCGAHDHDLQEA